MADFAAFQKLFPTAKAFDLKPVFESQTRNADAFVKAVEVVSKNVQELAARQLELVQANAKDAVSFAQGSLQVQDLKGAVERQVSFVKESTGKAAAQVKELADIAVKGNAEATAILRTRADEFAAEMKAIAAQAAKAA